MHIKDKPAQNGPRWMRAQQRQGEELREREKNAEECWANADARHAHGGVRACLAACAATTDSLATCDVLAVGVLSLRAKHGEHFLAG